MRSGDRTRPALGAGLRGSARPRRATSASEVAWLALVPCAALTLVAMLALGPLVGRLLPTEHVTPWPTALPLFRPEPTELGRYLVALAGPLLLTGAIALAGRRPPQVGPSAAAWVRVVQALGLALIAACIVSQYAARFEARYTKLAGTAPRTVYFTVATLVAACAFALAAAAGIRDARVRERARALLRESPRRRAAAWAIVALALAVSLLPSINFEHTIVRATLDTRYHMMFTLDETYAVLDGRSPLVDFAAQYGSLWPYPLAALMDLLGASVGSFTVLAALLTALALGAVFAVLRRVVRSAPAALALFLPLLATSFYMMSGSSANRYSLVTLTGIFPLRLAGPLLLLLATARHLDRARPRSRAALFTVAGLVVLNNADFGVPALGATLAALLWARPPRGGRAVALLAGELAAGLLAAWAALAALTLIRAGELPDLALLTRYARLFTGAGFGLLPVKPLIGVSTIVYLTYVAAIATATVRAAGAAEDRLMTGLLAWSGAFGLGLGAYYAGRSHPEVLTNMFPAWALALTLLFALTVRTVAARPSHLPTLAEAACLAGFGLLVCSLAQLPAPWLQVQRLRATTSRTFSAPGAERFLAVRTRAHEPVAILSLLGHRLAARVGVSDVTPYTGEESMPTREQLDQTLTALRRAGGRQVFAPLSEPWPEVHQALQAAGFRIVSYDERADLVQLSAGP